MAKLSDELKKAVAGMPTKEKDKLLFRLIAKDAVLTEKLEHELLASDSDTEERVTYLEKLIQVNIPPKGIRYLTPGFLMMDMRPLNAQITHHVKVTKDKFGAVTLTILLLSTAFERHLEMLEAFPRKRSETFKKYIIQRLNFIIKTASKLHEDYRMEFEDDLNELLKYVYRFDSTAEAAQEAGIPREF
jgi:hypothetical protein